MYASIFFSVIILILIFPNLIYSRILNVCSNLQDYYSMNSKNCWHNPEFQMSTPEIIARHNYPLETYETCTEDGYYLTMFRMPQKNKKRRGIVYLQHAMATNSLVYVDKGVNGSLAFTLYDLGYEIWMGNFRGTQFSRKHKTLDVKSKEFWDFSFHDIGIYDIRNKIDLIVRVAKAEPQEISYIGISMSTTAGTVYATLYPGHSSKWLNVMIFLAPTINLAYNPPYLEMLCSDIQRIDQLVKSLNLFEVAGRNDFMYNMLSICRSAPFMSLCVIGDLVFFGMVPDEVPAEWVPVKYAHNPDSCSAKTFMHYAHCIHHKNFVMYDYGKEKNLKLYNSTSPPLYPVQNISVPIFLVPAENDSLSLFKNVEELYKRLPEKAKKYGWLPIKNFGHASFVYATNLITKVHIPIINLINKIRKHVK